MKIKDESSLVDDKYCLQLFEEISNYYTPQSNEYIKSKLNKIVQKKFSGEGNNTAKNNMKDDLLDQVKHYYHALGRIMVRFF